MTGPGVGRFLRFARHWLARPRWTPRRSALMAATFTVLPLLEAVIWAGLLADEVASPAYRRRRVRAPLFIVGNFRSGTTLLHRLLARDEERFTTMKMWEILFAPSIQGRRMVSAGAALDRLAGGFLARRLGSLEEEWDERNPMHRVSLAAPEEDDYLLLHTWSALTIGLSSGLLEEARPYAEFDRALPVAERRRIMAFYRRCVQRHLHHRDPAGGRTYLAKNPALTPKLDSVLETFPDARVVYLLRSPLEAVPSFLSMMEFSWRILGEEGRRDELREMVIAMARHWYGPPLERVAGLPPEQGAVVRYDDLVADPEATVLDLYRRFGLRPSQEFAGRLHRRAEAARSYSSRHDYDLAALGLDRRRLLDEFADVFERHGFPRP